MRRYTSAAVAVLMLLVAAAALANSYSTPDIDGRVEMAEHDWDTDERAGLDPRNDCRFYPDEADLRDLWVTWDADNLYFGVRTQNGPALDPGNGYVLYIDKDAQAGMTGATDFASATFYARNITFSTIGVDAIFGVWDLGSGSEGIRHCDDLAVMDPIEGAYALMNPGVKHYEGVIPWDGLYGLGEGMVPPGTVLRFVAAIVGGDNTGAFDALPSTSTGIEADPGTPREAITDLDLYVEIPLDADLDGIPDRNYPPGGGIAGIVALGDTTDTETVVRVAAYQGGEEVWFDKTPAGGGEYEIERLASGFYDVIAEAESYMSETIEGVEVVSDTLVTLGIDFALQRVTGRIEGEVAISGGPTVDVTVGAYDTETGEPVGEGEVVVEGGTGAFSIRTVVDGEWLVLADAKGYVEADTFATIAGGDTAQVGLLELPVVAATKYGFSDESGDNIYSVGTTVSLPADTIYYWAKAWVEPRDDGDRVAYWDYDAQRALLLMATKLDPAYPTDGDILFADPDTVELPYEHNITADMFEDGRAPFLVSGDAVEVVRVRAVQDTAGNVTEGFLEVGIDPPAPVTLELTTDVTTIAAGVGVATISGQLIDASGNEAQVAGIIANMTSSGVGDGGGFSIPSPETDPDGKFNVGYTAATAGTTYVTATVDPSSPYPNLTINELTVVITPDVAAYVAIEPDPRALRAEDVSTILAQVKDAWGNNVEEPGLSIALTADPPTLLESIESPIVTDATGFASGEVASGTTYGTVAVTGTAVGVEVGTIFLPIDATIRAMDEVAPESDDAHNSDPGADLTALRVSNSADELIVGMIFDSDWGGAHLGICIEANGDAAGATAEPFVFPITYGHSLLPEYAFTYKYYDRSYADFRRWNGDISRWQWQDWDTGGWLTVDVDPWVDGVASQERQMDHEGYDVYFRVPFETIGVAVGDTVRVQGYTMQEVPGDPDAIKYTALDSAPHDDTHDMLPASGDWWETAEQAVTLSSYQTYVLREAGFAPELSNSSATPSPAQPGQVVTYSVQVTGTGGGIGDVFVNLSEIGGEAFVRMTDDGSRGDEYARDGTYTAQDELTSVAANGEHTVTATASDATNETSSTLGIVVNVDNPATAIREFEDSEGDDHGPNQTTSGGEGIEGLYYEYPTNQVFPDGAFDITSVKIFADGARIVFRTYIGQLADHQSGAAADWGAPNPSQQTCDNPNRTDLNLQKIDIYIDAMEGKGATSGFPDRLVDVATVDAWDYGIAVEGWGKWFVISHSSNSIATWERLEDDASISMCDDHVRDYVDVSVERTLLGLPEDPSMNDAIALWDIIVCLSSHDGDSNRDNLGGIRLVNGNTSEWQIGGGRDGEGGRDRDANIMDIAASPGLGHEPGRPQEEMLDYTTAEARRRFDDNKVACVIEASFAVDTSPPVIAPFAFDPELQHVPWEALSGAPGVFWTTITDVTGVETARLHWHPVGLPALVDSVEMVNLIGDVWAADIPRQEISENTSIVGLNKVGDARVLEGWVYAVDSSDSVNATRTSTVTFGVLEPWSYFQTIAVGDTLDQDETKLVVFQDGTVITVEGSDLTEARGDVEFTVTPVPESLVDTANIRDDMEFVGVARDITAEFVEGTASSFEGSPMLTLHYPQYDVGGLDEGDFGLFGWVPDTERWILKGGASNPSGNTVTGEILDAGTYGIFYWESLDVGGSEGLSGVMVEPNPFSPNGDGIYDKTIITYFLGREADYVNLEFYDLEGRLVRRLVFQEATDFTGRTPITREWDGTDKHGNVVPYGIYVMRVEAKFKTEPTFERVNRPVVIIK